MAAENRDRATIYPTLWQPILTWGIPRDYAVFALFLGVGVMLVTALFGSVIVSRVLFFATLALAWLVGFVGAMIDPDFFSVLLAKVAKIGRTKGGSNGNEYLA